MVENRILTREETDKALARKRTKSKVGKIVAMSCIYLVLLILYAPLIYVTLFSFSSHSITGLWGADGFTFKNYQLLFDVAGNVYSSEIWNAALNTVLVAVVSGIISTVLGTLGAIGIYYLRKKWMRNAMDFATQIPIVNAEIVTGVSLFILFLFFKNVLGLPRNFFTLVIGHVVLTLPYVVISVIPKLEQMDPSLYEAALDLGATRRQALWKVIIPEIIPGILSGFMLSITLSLDDFVITEFTKPESGNFETISTYVDNQLSKGGLPPQMRAFTAVLFAVILLVMIGMFVKTSIDTKKQRRLSSNKGELL